jgi:hypothetical protein
MDPKRGEQGGYVSTIPSLEPLAAESRRPCRSARQDCERISIERSSACPHEIGFGEIIALVEQRFAGELGKRIGKAIAEIESSRMSAAATEVAIGFTRDPGLLGSHRLDDKVGCRHKFIESTAGDGIATAVDHDRSLNEVDG